jgi:hypothetical protein
MYLKAVLPKETSVLNVSIGEWQLGPKYVPI